MFHLTFISGHELYGEFVKIAEGEIFIARRNNFIGGKFSKIDIESILNC